MKNLINRRNIMWVAVGATASPFSAAATQAIASSFSPAQVEIINEWGWRASGSDILIVNTYAVEDPRIMITLVEELGLTRLLCGDGRSFIETDIPINSTTYSNYLWKIKTSLVWASGQWSTQGVGGGSVCTTGMGISGTGNWAYSNGITDLQGGQATGYVGLPIIQELDYEKRTFLVKNTADTVLESISNINIQAPQAPGYNILFGWQNYLKTNRYIHASKNAEAYLRAGSFSRHFVPFVLGTARASTECYPQVAQQAGAVGMIDVIDGLFYPNANSVGTFSIVEE